MRQSSLLTDQNNRTLMFIVNHSLKHVYWSKGKLGTTSLRIAAKNKLSKLYNWEIMDEYEHVDVDDVTSIDWGTYSDYKIFCPIRSPISRYYSGLMEDIFRFYKTMPNYDINQLTDEIGFHDAIDHLYGLTNFDMSLANSYHVTNWMNDIVYLTLKNKNVHIFNMDYWNDHYWQYYNKKDIEKFNKTPNGIKIFVKNYFENSQNKKIKAKKMLESYLDVEIKMFEILKNSTDKNGKINLSKTKLKFIKQYMIDHMYSFSGYGKHLSFHQFNALLDLID